MAVAGGMSSEPSLIDYSKPPNHLKFIIMEAPKDTNLHVFIKLFKKHNVCNVVRISEPRYKKEGFEEAGIAVHVRILFLHTHSFIDTLDVHGLRLKSIFSYGIDLNDLISHAGLLFYSGNGF